MSIRRASTDLPSCVACSPESTETTEPSLCKTHQRMFQGQYVSLLDLFKGNFSAMAATILSLGTTKQLNTPLVTGQLTKKLNWTEDGGKSRTRYNSTQALKAFCRACFKKSPTSFSRKPPKNSASKQDFTDWADQHKVDISDFKTRTYNKRSRTSHTSHTSHTRDTDDLFDESRVMRVEERAEVPLMHRRKRRRTDSTLSSDTELSEESMDAEAYPIAHKIEPLINQPTSFPQYSMRYSTTAIRNSSRPMRSQTVSHTQNITTVTAGIKAEKPPTYAKRLMADTEADAIAALTSLAEFASEEDSDDEKRMR
mmetsp:Transcript_473/g.552  ORF Transcript_473/g.552 Transcript_473/m.552 type:complete len:311 (+) Transcript_473:52-984(+)